MAKRKHPPDNADRVPSSGEMTGNATETPLERVGRHIREMKEQSPSGWAELTESGKLERLDRLDWRGVEPLERLCVIEVEVDLNRVSPRTQRNYLGKIRDHVLYGLSDWVMATLPPSSALPVEADTPPVPSPSEIIADPRRFLTQEQLQNGQSLPRAGCGDRGHDNGRKM